MVEMGHHVVLVALHDLLCEEWLFGFGIRTIAKTMTLLVGFSSHIKTIFVAEVIPHGVIGIVAGTHSVDVQAFHNLNVLNHTLAADHISAIGIHLVAVGSLDEYRLTIHQQLRILDFHAAETNLLGDDLDGFALLLLDIDGFLYVFLFDGRNGGRINLYHKSVKIRSLGCPVFHIQVIYIDTSTR